MLFKLILSAIGIFCISIHGMEQQPIRLSVLDAKTVTQEQILDLKNIYLTAFSSVYKKDWDEKFAKQQCDLLEYYIAQYYVNNEMILIIAHKNEQLVGWALFTRKDNENAILEILCIVPEFWRQGIGKKLVFVICELYPAISHISVMTRKINPISPQFYEAIGFKKTDLHLPDFIEMEKLQGYEWWRQDSE